MLFTDGSLISCTESSRFEVIGAGIGRIRAVPAGELEHGDEVILLEGGVHALFSEKLIAAMDDGSLKVLAERRAEWLTLVQSVSRATNLKIANVARSLVAQGHEVNPATVRSWITFESEREASVPRHRATFLALARTVGIMLPESYLIDLFDAIRRWRTLHRKAGRDLSRAMRAAFADRLDAVALARIEREWGLSARQLLQGARLAVIDEVLPY